MSIVKSIVHPSLPQNNICGRGKQGLASGWRVRRSRASPGGTRNHESTNINQRHGGPPSDHHLTMGDFTCADCSCVPAGNIDPRIPSYPSRLRSSAFGRVARGGCVVISRSAGGRIEKVGGGATSRCLSVNKLPGFQASRLPAPARRARRLLGVSPRDVTVANRTRTEWCRPLLACNVCCCCRMVAGDIVGITCCPFAWRLVGFAV